MILRPWPMILRSFPITDFSPVEGALIDDSALLVLVGRVVRGSSALSSAGELRVNMKSPNEARPGIRQAGLPAAIFLAPHPFVAYLAIVVGGAITASSWTTLWAKGDDRRRIDHKKRTDGASVPRVPDR